MATRFLSSICRRLSTTSLRRCDALIREEKIGEEISAKRARLLYQSKKRGILENDIVLGEFAEQKLESLNEDQLNAYDKLINGKHMEWDLFYYLSDKKSPPSDISKCQIFKMVKEFVDKKKTTAIA